MEQPLAGVPAAMPAWRYAWASVPGTSHVRDSLPCQDYALAATLPEAEDAEILLAVVSDGAGSAARAAEGAQEACRAFQEIAGFWTGLLGADHLAANFGDTALEAIRGAIDLLSTEQRLPSAAFACTLVAAVLGERAAFFLQVGDGAVAYRAAGRSGWTLALPPQRGEFANTTIFVTRPDAPRHLRVVRIDARVEEVALMTDGVEFLAIDQRSATPHARFMEHTLRGLRAETGVGASNAMIGWLGTFLDSPQVNQRTDDDKTLLIATRAGC